MKKNKGIEVEVEIENDDHMLEGDMHTLSQAAKLAGDPKRLEKIKKLAGRKHKAVMDMIEPLIKKPKKIKSLDDLRKVSNGEKDDDSEMEM